MESYMEMDERRENKCATCDDDQCLSCVEQISQDNTYRLRWNAIKREIGRAPDPATREYMTKMVEAIEEGIR